MLHTQRMCASNAKQSMLWRIAWQPLVFFAQSIYYVWIIKDTELLLFMALTQKTNKASGIFFFTGFIFSKLQFIPFKPISNIFKFLSLSIYSCAYGLWFTTTALEPEEHATIKKTFLIASSLGFFTTILSITAMFVPILLLPAAWLYFIENMIWTIGEYFKLKHHSNDTHSTQDSYFFYSITTTMISLVTTVTVTLLFLFPLLTIPITIISVILYVGLGITSLQFWLDSNSKHSPPNSYLKMKDTFGPSSSPEPTVSPEPSHSKSLFANEKKEDTIISNALYKDYEKEHSLSTICSL